MKIHYEVYGDGGRRRSCCMPTWTIVHKRFWKAQIPYLARHHRVVTYDGPGNGRSDRPLETAAYAQEAQVAYALAVLDATGTDRAVLVALSKAANWALDLAANHPDRVLGTVLIGPSVALAASAATRTAIRRLRPGRYRDRAVRGAALGERSAASTGPSTTATTGRTHYEDFLWFFFGQCFPEPHSTKQIEDAVAWGRETTARVLVADSQAAWPDAGTRSRTGARRITGPVLLIHGDDDRISPLRRSEMLAELTGGELVVLRRRRAHPAWPATPSRSTCSSTSSPSGSAPPGAGPHLVAVEPPAQAGALPLLADRPRPRPARPGDRRARCASGSPACGSTGSPSIR